MRIEDEAEIERVRLAEIERVRLAEIERLRIKVDLVINVDEYSRKAKLKGGVDLLVAELSALQSLKVMEFKKELRIAEMLSLKVAEKVRVELAGDLMVAQLDMLQHKEAKAEEKHEGDEAKISHNKMEISNAEDGEKLPITSKSKGTSSPEDKSLEGRVSRRGNTGIEFLHYASKDSLHSQNSRDRTCRDSTGSSTDDERDSFQAIKRKPVELDRGPKPFYPPWAHGIPPLYETRTPSPPKKYKPVTNSE